MKSTDLIERECPQCHRVRKYQARNTFCSRECSAAHQKEAAAATRFSQESRTEGHTISGNTWEILLPKTRIHTLEELMKSCEVDLSTWEVDRFVVNKWEVGAMPKATGSGSTWAREDSAFVVEPLYQVKAWLKRKTVVCAVRDELEEMWREFARTALRFKAIKRSRRKHGNVPELTIPDLHLGKLAWSRETGHADYDVRIAKRTFETAVAVLIERTSSFKFDKILLIVGNDMLNADNAEGTTTAGTPVTNDTRYPKTFEIARRMLTRAIEHLREIAPVRVVVVPGNHDALSSWHMGHSLWCYFHKCEDVTVDNEPTKFKYYQFGSVMLMWAHGDTGKLPDYPLLMATEQPQMFGATKFREAHTGDKHQVMLTEKHGVRVRILPSLCEPDDWHAGKTFVGNLKSAEACVWNKTDGLIGTAIYSFTDLQSPKKTAK